jgi:signal transduction histidine kinase
LISNALKYTPHGYINVTLRKKPLQRKPGKERGALVEFIVEDSGIGMSNEFQVKSLFRPFRQENTLTPGTGLVSIASYDITVRELTRCSRG